MTKTVVATPAETGGERTELELLWVNYRKALTSQVRLKHSIRADRELNTVIKRAKLTFDKQVQQGITPALPDFAAALNA